MFLFRMIHLPSSSLLPIFSSRRRWQALAERSHDIFPTFSSQNRRKLAPSARKSFPGAPNKRFCTIEDLVASQKWAEPRTKRCIPRSGRSPSRQGTTGTNALPPPAAACPETRASHFFFISLFLRERRNFCVSFQSAPATLKSQIKFTHRRERGRVTLPAIHYITPPGFFGISVSFPI